MNYLISRSGQSEGPYTEEAIREAALAGTLSSDDLCWTEGMPTWIPLSDVPGLIPSRQEEITTSLRSRGLLWTVGGLILAAGVLYGFHSLTGKPALANATSTGVSSAPMPAPVSSAHVSTTASDTPLSSVPPPLAAIPSTPFVPVAPAVPAKPRTPLELAVERTLRDEVVGGATNEQISEAADAQAKIIQERHSDMHLEQCYDSADPKTQKFSFEMMAKLSGDKSEPGLTLWMLSFYQPPRMILRTDAAAGFSPLPPREWTTAADPLADGCMTKEHLASLQSAIKDLSRYHDRTGSPDDYWKQLAPSLDGNLLVLSATYNAFLAAPARTFYFWYKKAPSGLADLLTKMPKDHPIFDIGAPISDAPEKYPLALNVLAKTASENLAPQAPLPSSDLAPTADDIARGILQSIVHAGGAMVDKNRARLATPTGAMFSSYWVFRVVKVTLLKPPIASGSNHAFDCSYHDAMTIGSVLLGMSGRVVEGPILENDENLQFIFDGQYWWSPELRDRALDIINRSENQTLHSFDQFDHNPWHQHYNGQ